MRTERWLAIAIGLLAFAATPVAHAYCRTTTCSPKTCVPSAECANCMTTGIPLYWPGGCTSFSIQYNGSSLRGITAKVAGQLIAVGLGQWMSADCGGGAKPSLALYQTQDVACHQQEYNQDAPNANIWMFRDDAWPYTGSGSTLALTTVTFNVKTGEIFDADVEINSAKNPLTVGDENVQADLQSIVTHEAGHFLGLSHTCDTKATMFAQYGFGDTSLRSLGPDDIAGICEIYPPGTDATKCDATPRHGFSSDCGDAVDKKSCCTLAPGRPGSGGGAALMAMALGLAAAALRRKKPVRRR
jgi:Matrixin